MIYEFFDRTKAGALCNLISGLFKSQIPVRFIDYVDIETYPVIKRFTFGIEGNTFDLKIQSDDTISINSTDDMPHTGEFQHLRVRYMGPDSNTNKYLQEFKQELISFIRDNKINQVL